MSILNKIIKKKDEKDEKKDAIVSKEIEEKKKTKEIKERKTINEKVTKKETENRKKNKPVAKIKKVSKDKAPDHYFDLVEKPHISEKTFNLSNENQYVFVVSDRSNKSEIKKAIGNLYGVSVVSVNIISVPSKPKRFKGRQGVKSGYKKAIVKLAKGSTIDLMKEAK
ncbi:MAG: 50S ribosomal protein L23 [Candidatus Pacebacteria bacterium]|nr:50S ribosomal protein L23 [Candidatus Paceibacterota bacterium]